MDGYGQKALMLSLPFLFMLPWRPWDSCCGMSCVTPSPTLAAPKRASATEDDSTGVHGSMISRTGLFGPMQMLLDAGRASE